MPEVAEIGHIDPMPASLHLQTANEVQLLQPKKQIKGKQMLQGRASPSLNEPASKKTL
jgi:hypothetical protein